MPKLQSMDVTLRGVTKTFVFDPATPVESSDEGEASLEVLHEGETTEVNLIEDGIYSARVSISYTVRIDGQVDVDLEDLDGMEYDEIVYAAERGDFSAIDDAIQQDVEYQLSESIEVQQVDIEECFDEDGNTVDQ